MMTHADDVALSDYADGRAVANDIAAHAEACQTCRERVHSFRQLRDEASRERIRTYAAPDIWPALAAHTIHRAAVRQIVMREWRRAFALWLLAAFLLGVVATEGLRGLSHQIARLSAKAAPAPDIRHATEALKKLNKIAGRW